LVKKIIQLFLTLFIAALLALAPVAPGWAEDGDDGGSDSGGDGGSDEEGGEDDGQGRDQDSDGDGHPDKDGHGHHGRHHHHIHSYGGWPAWGFGPAFGYMPPYYPPAYYGYGYPPVAVRSAPPAVYIERKDAPQPATQSQGNFWHYCRSAEDYYPQVKECPDGWEQVAPQAKEDSQD
jgi:hypothetical protein